MISFQHLQWVLNAPLLICMNICKKIQIMLSSSEKYDATLYGHLDNVALLFQNLQLHVLIGVAQLLEHQHAEPRVFGSILGQGTCLRCGFCLGGGVLEMQPTDVPLAHEVFYPSFSLHSSLSQNK